MSHLLDLNLCSGGRIEKKEKKFWGSETFVVTFVGVERKSSPACASKILTCLYNVFACRGTIPGGVSLRAGETERERARKNQKVPKFIYTS